MYCVNRSILTNHIFRELVMRKVPDKQVALVSVAGYKTSLMSIRNLLRHVFVNMGNGMPLYQFLPFHMI